MRIAALTCRSFYSLLRGAVSVPRWVQRAAELGYGALALADVNGMAGVADLCQAAEKVDLRPIVGVEILTETQQAILLAEDDRGYGNLCRITTARNLPPAFDLVEQLKVDSRGVICICSQQSLMKELEPLFPRAACSPGVATPRRPRPLLHGVSNRLLVPPPTGSNRRISRSRSSWRGYGN
jgi:DNA polymerase III alpha subunit